jgi:hypothetical protein
MLNKSAMFLFLIFSLTSGCSQESTGTESSAFVYASVLGLGTQTPCNISVWGSPPDQTWGPDAFGGTYLIKTELGVDTFTGNNAILRIVSRYKSSNGVGSPTCWNQTPIWPDVPNRTWHYFVAWEHHDATQWVGEWAVLYDYTLFNGNTSRRDETWVTMDRGYSWQQTQGYAP